jgi:hypothetical protein
VTPPFDPEAFARQPQARPSPAAGIPGTGPADAHTRKTLAGMPRPAAPTLTDPDELEEARLRSIQSNPAPRKATPAGALSLANARIPSNLPPPPSKATEVSPAPRDAEQNAQPDAPGRAERSPEGPPPTEREMNDRVSVGDYTGALAIAERLLAIDPDNLPASACADTCRSILRQMYATRLGPLDRVPIVTVSRDQLKWLTIDHRAGFVLSLVDGVSSLEMILDVSGMPELDALRILAELAQQRIISFR